MRANRLKRTLRERPCYGAWLFSGAASAAEILALEAFDALIIDQEHSPNGIEATLAQLRAIAAAGDASLLVRVPDGSPATIKLALDAGAEGIVAPRIESADEARALVAACRYPLHGSRGAHYTVSRAARWGTAAAEYLQHYRDELLIVAMIESEAGVRAARDIAAVDGIDMLFLGPLDLTADFGCIGRFDDPRIAASIAALPGAVREQSAVPGSTTLPGFDARRLLAAGYRFITLGSDVGFLQQGARSALALVEKE